MSEPTGAVPRMGALAGVRVLEVASYITGPYAGMLLADLGAEVVKLEHPERGDEFRRWSGGQQGYGPTFCAFNRGKRSLALDLRSDEGRALAFRLASRADVLIENFRPGVMERLGLGYEVVRDANPSLVYCSISGFGQDGPYANRPGFDCLGLGLGGLLGLLSDPDRTMAPGIAVGDIITAMSAAYGVLGALVARQQTGRGQRVETSLLRSTVAFMGEIAAHAFASGEAPARMDRVRRSKIYTAAGSDGLPFVVHLSSPDKFWALLVEAIGRPELKDDPRFRTSADRGEHHDAAQTIVEEAAATRTRAEWLTTLQARGVPCSPVNTIPEVFEDPQVRHLGLEVAPRHPRMGACRMAANPVSLSETPAEYVVAPPLLGEHTAEVLAELGLTPAEIADLLARGVARQTD